MKALLFDLEAGDRGIRLSAIVQLHHFLGSAEVVNAFLERLPQEDDEECRFYLESGLRKEGARHLRLTIPQAVSDSCTLEEFVQKFRGSPVSEQQQLLRGLSGLKNVDPGKAICAIIQGAGEGIRRIETILTILAAPESYFVPEGTHGILVSFLCHGNHVVAQRALQILSHVAPQKCVSLLPDLLLHPSVSVRAMAIFALYKICPPEALRLLGEFLENADPKMRGLGLSLLFNFPFEAVSGLLFGLIDRNAVPPSSLELVKALIKSNPDRTFLAQLSFLLCRRPGEVPLAEELVGLVAEGLLMAGMGRGSIDEIVEKYRKEAEKRLGVMVSGIPGVQGAPEKPPSESSEVKKDTGPKVGHDDQPKGPAPEPPLPPESSPVKKATEAASHQAPPRSAGSPDEDLGTKIRRLAGISAFGAGATDELARAVEMSREEDHQLAVVDIVAKRQVRNERVARGICRFLEYSSEKVKIAVMNSLAGVAPKTLLPHLAMLCNNPSAMVASLAIQKMRAIESSGFFRRLGEWVKDTHPNGKRAALIALTQMEIGQSKRFIFSLLQKMTDLPVIESYGNILLMNPEISTYLELKEMALSQPYEKKVLLLGLAEKCRENYEQIAGQEVSEGWKSKTQALLKEFQLEEKWEIILQQVRKIHYQVQGTDLSGTLSDRRLQLLVLGGLLLLLGWYLLADLFFPEKSSFETREGKAPISFTLNVPKPSGSFAEGTTLAGTLDSYDPLNHYWKFTGIDGSVVKILFPARDGTLAEKDTLLLTLSPRGKTRTGYPLYHVKAFKRISGLQKK